jgi:hypothetical protein
LQATPLPLGGWLPVSFVFCFFFKIFEDILCKF